MLRRPHLPPILRGQQQHHVTFECVPGPELTNRNSSVDSTTDKTSFSWSSSKTTVKKNSEKGSTKKNVDQFHHPTHHPKIPRKSRRQIEEDVDELSSSISSQYPLLGAAGGDSVASSTDYPRRNEYITNASIHVSSKKTPLVLPDISHSSSSETQSKFDWEKYQLRESRGKSIIRHKKTTHFPQRNIIKRRRNQNSVLKTMFPRISAVRQGAACPSQLYTKFKNLNLDKFNGSIQMEHYLQHQDQIEMFSCGIKKFKSSEDSDGSDEEGDEVSWSSAVPPPNSAVPSQRQEQDGSEDITNV